MARITRKEDKANCLSLGELCSSQLVIVSFDKGGPIVSLQVYVLINQKIEKIFNIPLAIILLTFFVPPIAHWRDNHKMKICKTSDNFLKISV